MVALPGVDEIHIGLNDLCISQGKKFLFQPLADGTVDAVCAKIKAAGIPFGFGGFGRLGGGTLPAAYIVAEHYRLGSSMSILSRAFCNTAQITDLEAVSYTHLTNTFKMFDQNLALTGGAPEQKTELLALNIYNTFYGRSGWQGVGQAKAVVFFIIVALLAFLQLRVTGQREAHGV